SRVALEVLQSDANDSAAALLERGEVAGRLCLDETPEAELLPRNRNLVAGIVDHLHEEASVRAAFVELSRRVQVARAEAVRDDATGLRAGRLDQRLELLLARGVDERLDRDVVAWARLCKQLLERAARLDVRILARRQHLVGAVLGRLHVRLVERVDL